MIPALKKKKVKNSKMGEGEWEIQASGYGMSKSWE